MLVVVGPVLAALALVWRLVAPGMLVRFPTDLDVTPRYEGTFTLLVDPATTAPLGAPLQLPLVVNRHLKADGNASSHSRVVIDETIALDIDGGRYEATQLSRYVMDRRKMWNVADPRAYAYDPADVVDRSPAYRLAFELNTKPRDHDVYKNEIGATYQARPDPTAPTGTVGGLHVINFRAHQGPLPITDAYLTSLDRVIAPLPRQLGLDKLTPLLEQAGIDVGATLAGLVAANITPDDLKVLTDLGASPIKLQYLLAFDGEDSVEPETGSIVDVRNVVETVSARPDPSTLPPLLTVLQKYPNVPAAATALAGLQKLADQPIPVFVNAYSQTDASVTDIAGTVRDQRDRIHLVERTIPRVLVVLGVIVSAVGIAWRWRQNRRARVTASA